MTKKELIFEQKIFCQNIRLTGASRCNNMGDYCKFRNKMADISPLINSLYSELIYLHHLALTALNSKSYHIQQHLLPSCQRSVEWQLPEWDCKSIEYLPRPSPWTLQICQHLDPQPNQPWCQDVSNLFQIKYLDTIFSKSHKISTLLMNYRSRSLKWL